MSLVSPFVASRIVLQPPSLSPSLPLALRLSLSLALSIFLSFSLSFSLSLSLGCQGRSDKARSGSSSGSPSEGPPRARASDGEGAAQRAAPAPAGEGAQTREDGATASAPGRPATPASETAQGIGEAEVNALLKAWLDAQNRGDLEAYLALYAQTFTGVKRVNTLTRRFDRQGWAKDRGRMFTRKMTVEAKDVTVALHSRSAILRFEQRWSSGDFQDEGPKQLVLVREGTALRIAREEMLASRVLKAPALSGGPGSVDLSGGRFLMVAPVTEGQALHVILEHRPQAGWAKAGHLTLQRSGLVIRDVDEARLPIELQAWKGKRLTVYSQGKPSCEATVQGFALMAEVVPHFGTRQEWEGESDGRKRTDAEVAQAIWALATGNNLQTQKGPGLWLVARVDKGRAACPGGASFARDASLAPPVIWTKLGSSPLVAKALAAYRALPAWGRLQKEYRQEEPQGSWDLHEGAKPRVDIFRHPTEGRQLVVASARAGAGCGRFEGQLWVAWEVEGETWTRITREETDRHFQVTEVFSAAGDGRPQLLDPSALVVPQGKLYTVLLTYEPPFYDCGC